MIRFDTNVQVLKYKVLKEIAYNAYKGTLLESIDKIPEKLFPEIQGQRVGIFRGREVAKQRIKIAMGGDINNPNVIEVISLACDECPIGGYEVTNACRGCIAHRCEEACNFNAISFDKDKKAHIDKDKCKECGMCSKVCPYAAIVHLIRPCKNACKVNALSMDEYDVATIDNSKCIACGACVYMCPFGAIMDKSYILDVIDIIKKSNENKNYKVYAIVAPAIASQYSDVKLGQVISGIKKLGFHSVLEVAWGADMVAKDEASELVHEGFLTSSCCPAFVEFIKKNYPDLVKSISKNLSPMGKLAEYLKKIDSNSKIVFIGPCTAKKQEIKLDNVKKLVDVAMTFEELQAMFDAKGIDLASLEETNLDNASYFGRIFARSGGLGEAVKEAIKELKIENFELNPCICDGIEQCNVALLKKSKNLLDANFIEGMACVGGCIGGAGCLTHGIKNKNEIEKYGKDAGDRTIIYTTGVATEKLGTKN